MIFKNPEDPKQHVKNQKSSSENIFLRQGMIPAICIPKILISIRVKN